jgi:dihydrofolate reductase
MIVSLIAAVAENNVIGKDNRLIWRMPADMKFFKDKTTGHCVVTGRKNYESIPEKFRPLPDRNNIVVTRQKKYSAPGAIVVNTIEDAVNVSKSKNETELFIIGGANIYTQTIPTADRLYITWIHHTFEGDAFFPPIDPSKWKETTRIEYPADEKNPYPYTFCVLDKI